MVAGAVAFSFPRRWHIEGTQTEPALLLLSDASLRKNDDASDFPYYILPVTPRGLQKDWAQPRALSRPRYCHSAQRAGMQKMDPEWSLHDRLFWGVGILEEILYNRKPKDLRS